MSKRVYKFISAEYGICNLQNKRLKLSTIDDLNDPFDLRAIDITDPAIDAAVEAVVLRFKHLRAILCFSRNWDNLLLWSHYGASHTGICLGFDIPDGEPGLNYDTDVLYQPNLLQIRRRDDVNIDLTDRLLRTKHESWSYEQEVRMFVKLTDPPDVKGLRWIGFQPVLELKEVIIGAQCIVSNAVTNALAPFGSSVTCTWAGMRKDAFGLVRQEQPPPWQS